MIELSLNEVETLAQKAARGAGLPWGVAEDAGRAAAWIARRIGPWAGTLLALLETPPPPTESPLLLAGALADGTVQKIPRLAFPLWALPGLLVAPSCAISIQLDADCFPSPCGRGLGGGGLTPDRVTTVLIGGSPGEEPRATLPAQALAELAAAALTVRFAPGLLPYPLPIRFRRSVVPDADYRRLTALAFRTYVPDSDRSRLTGAGAGLLDDE